MNRIKWMSVAMVLGTSVAIAQDLEKESQDPNQWVLPLGSYSGIRHSKLSQINTKNADGYYGWEEAAPFDKIIVTCGIDHIPPPLLQQLKPGGVMVIPVGPPGAQRVLKVTKEQGPNGQMTIARSDIYNGKIVPFVAFTKLEGDVIKGTHNQ